MLASYVLIRTITNAGYGDADTYRAQFTDVTGLVEGDEVRIAGVRVGQVTSIGLAAGSGRRRSPWSAAGADVGAAAARVQATIRYRNLVGQRYIALTEAPGSAGRMLPAGGLIPLTQTKPALDLTMLFGGFRPLLQAPHPADINRLSYEIIQVFQGEGGTVESCSPTSPRSPTPWPTRTRSSAASSAISSTVLGSVAARDQELSASHRQPPAVRHRPGQGPGRRSSTRCSRSTRWPTSPATCWRRPAAPGRRHQASARSRRTSPTPKAARTLPPAGADQDRPDHPDRHNGSWFNFFICSASGYVVLPVTTGNPPGLQVPAGGLNNGANGCAGDGPGVQAVPRPQPRRHRRRQPDVIAVLVFLAFNAQSLPLIGGGTSTRRSSPRRRG